MEVKTQIHTSEFISDEDNGPGESSMSTNIYVEFQGIMPAQKDTVRAIVNRFYKELRSELKNIS